MVVVAEPHDRGAVAGRHHRAVVDRLVGPSVEEDRAVADEHRDHRHVDVRDRGQQQRILAADELGESVPRSRGTGAGCRAVVDHDGCVPHRARYSGTSVDDLLVEVEPQVVARRPVGEPPVADADLPADLLVDDRVHHRVRVLQAREIGDRRHPAVEPAVVVTAAGLAVGRRFGRKIAQAAVESVGRTPVGKVMLGLHRATPSVGSRADLYGFADPVLGAEQLVEPVGLEGCLARVPVRDVHRGALVASITMPAIVT